MPMTSAFQPSAANGAKSRSVPSPSSDPSSRIRNQPRSQTKRTAKGPVGRGGRPSGSDRRFVKIITLFIVVAIVDVLILIVWLSVDVSVEGGGDGIRHPGAEVGVHRLHEKERGKLLSDHARKNAAIAVNATGGAVSNSDAPRIDERIAKILKSANILDLDEETASQLPTWDDVVSMYGSAPIVYGLQTCDAYRQAVEPQDRMIGPAGIFNTGTNLLFQLMKLNCDIREARYSRSHRENLRNGARWQAPWGKHNPVSTHRLKNVAKAWGEGINQTAFFPVVTIKDPYGWMGSQCRHPYKTYWNHKRGKCPNLFGKSWLGREYPEQVVARFALGWERYESLTDLWNRWYMDYERQTFPMIRTRYEDLLFHGEAVSRMACGCVGGVFTRNFRYVEESAKQNTSLVHEGANGLVKALLQYGHPEKRLAGLTDRDRLYASKSLNSDLMRKYGYSAPPLPT